LSIIATVPAFLSLAFSAYGHETVSQDWCVGRNTTPVIVSRFNWDKSELIEIGQTCGIVDIGGGDEWSTANAIAHAYCKTQSQRSSLAVPFIAGPRV
jgi:2-methylcitrate dehydratase PrpD